VDNNNIYALFHSRFPQERAHTFIETPEGRRYTYADLERESGRYARFLTQLGIRPGDRIAVQVHKSPQALFLYLACLRAGFIYLPLNTAYVENELAYLLTDAEPAAVICRSLAQNMITALTKASGIPHVFTLDENGAGSLIDASENAEPQFDICARDAGDIAVLLYTSGTTGRPKGAMITHRNLAANGLALHEAWGWIKGDVLLHALPLFHVHGLFVASHCVLLNGGKMIFLDKFDAAPVTRLLPEATVFMGVPTYYTRLLAHSDFGKKVCRNMRLFTCGSAPLLEHTFHEFQQRTGHIILERYGMTETGMNTSNPLNGRRVAGTVGTPLPGVTARIVDENGREVARGTVGELQVRGDNVFKGYWRAPEKTAQDFTKDGYFKTGDLAKIGENDHICIVGRAKDMIISGGCNVYPKEIETCINDIEGVAESAVIGLPHNDLGEAVTAVVVRTSSGKEITESTLIQHLKNNVANYKVPKRVFFLDTLPRNTMGKVQKNILRENYADTFKN
jgi:malonyl-CoA/methylmalonyl-CoA synthetase